MEQIAGSRMFITHDGRSGMQMAPAVEMSPPEDAAYGGGAEMSGLGNLIGGEQLATQGDDLRDQLRRGSARAVERARGNDRASRAGPGCGSGGPTWRRFFG